MEVRRSKLNACEVVTDAVTCNVPRHQNGLQRVSDAIERSEP